jgi:ThiF family
MSARPAALEEPFHRLRLDGYEVELQQQHLLLHSVPYVAADRTVKLGTLVCTYVDSAGTLLAPDNHQVWWTGEFPCLADGVAISAIVNENTTQEIIPGLVIRHRFSNKPEGVTAFPEHYTKLTHYVSLLSDQARVIDPSADARTGRLIETTEDESVFRYRDSASVRAEIATTSARLAMNRVAFVGVGGTGAYALDHVVKAPVREIHLFDGGTFWQHTAFRAPGAASIEQLREHQPKVKYFERMYEPMRSGIVAHAYNLDASNVAELAGFDFVFVCVDRGEARKVILDYLITQGIPFVDVGMSVELDVETGKLSGTCRFTFATAGQSDHIGTYVPQTDQLDEPDLYRTNIQVSVLNAMNAGFAVIKWQQHCGFFHDDFGSHHGTFSVNSQSLTRDVMRKLTEQQ